MEHKSEKQGRQKTMVTEEMKLQITIAKADVCAKAVAKYTRDVAEMKININFFHEVRRYVFGKYGVHTSEIITEGEPKILFYRKRFHLDAYNMLSMKMGSETDNGYLRHYFAGLMNGYGANQIEEFVENKQETEQGVTYSDFHIVYEKRFVSVGTIEYKVHVVKELAHVEYYRSSEYKDKEMAKDKGIVGFEFDVSLHASRQELAKTHTMVQMAEMFPDINRFLAYM